jgi:transcriptional regulator with XRE-family HTH domain
MVAGSRKSKESSVADKLHTRVQARSRKPAHRPMGEGPFDPELGNGEVSVGQRLRTIRAVRRLSIRALAELSGLNVNTLSLIENGHTSPSVSTLQQLAQSLQVPITEFFETDHGSQKLVYQKHGQRPHVAFEHGMMEDLAAGMPRFGAEPIIVMLEPNADSGKKPIIHTGREFVYCLTGHIAYTVDNETYLLEPDDSLVFDAYLPHYWKNSDAALSRLLLVLSPMDERDSPIERHFAK